MNGTIRKVTSEEDLIQLADIRANAKSEFLPDINEEQALEYILKKHSEGIAAWMHLDEKPNAYLLCDYVKNTKGDDILRVLTLYTHPTIEGQGIATKLIYESINYARKTGLKSIITTSVERRNERANRLFNHFKFEPTRQDDHATIYRLRLDHNL